MSCLLGWILEQKKCIYGRICAAKYQALIQLTVAIECFSVSALHWGIRETYHEAHPQPCFGFKGSHWTAQVRPDHVPILVGAVSPSAPGISPTVTPSEKIESSAGWGLKGTPCCWGGPAVHEHHPLTCPDLFSVSFPNYN